MSALGFRILECSIYSFHPIKWCIHIPFHARSTCSNACIQLPYSHDMAGKESQSLHVIRIWRKYSNDILQSMWVGALF